MLLATLAVAVGAVGLVGYWLLANNGGVIGGETAAKATIEKFGQALKNVSLLSPQSAQEIEQNYGDLASPDLIKEWQTDPSSAPGRLTSSPSPDRIEVISIKKTEQEKYLADGEIVEIANGITPEEKFEKRTPVEIIVSRVGARWLITDFIFKQSEEKDWKESIYAESGVSFRYPETLGTRYASTQIKWPPEITIEDGDSFDCPATPMESSLSERIQSARIGERDYCIILSSEGAAGSVYTGYSYVTIINGRKITISFNLRYPNCGNYGDPQKTECESERESFDLNGIIGKIVESMKIPASSD